MAYSFDQIFAVDEANTSNVAQNTSVLIFAPGDTAKTPLTITTTDGQALANPVPVNANGFGPAFMHETLDRVAWEGGGYTGFFTSYDGMKSEAVAARAAAETAAADAADSAASAEASANLVAAPADSAVEALVSDPASATRVAMAGVFGPTATPMTDAFIERVDDKKYATLQAAVDATPTGGLLEIRRQWTISAAVNITKAMTVTCARGGSITTTGTGTHGFVITASDVTLDRVVLNGTGAGTAGTAAAIRVPGTEAAPVYNLTIRACTIKNFNKYGVEASSVRDFTISGNLIENIAYSGVTILAGIKGHILSNTVKNLTQPSGFVNSYGIAMTRNSATSLALSPRSSDILCSGNIVEGVTKWEAIDTHGGENLTITNNRIRNAYIGIALVPCPNESGTDTYAPRNIIVTGNDLDSGKTDGTNRAGIQLIGCITTVDNVVEYASGVIADNIVRNFGTENTGTQAGIFLQATRGSIVSKNRVVNASPSGIILTNNNQGALVLDNTFVDTWTNSATFTAAVYVSSVNQSITVQGNRAVRADKTATLVNNRGLFAAAAATAATVTIQYGHNHFKDCTLPIIDSPSTQNLTEQRVEARKISFYPGIAPVTRQTVAAAATDAASTQALANDLRAKLIALGLIV